ncbi:MAG: hypothetical protein E7211_08650 [Clostridium lundense]|nr:hypothetical protein [Clostridium lundense]
MEMALLLAFSDEKGAECSRCMLSGVKGLDGNGETVTACFALGIRPKCPEEGCRKDCPLIPVEEE